MGNLVNFRDLGGIPTTDDRIVQEKRILRAGQLVNLSDEEKEKLISEYDLVSIVDFRGAKEVASAPDDELDSVSYTHLDVLAGTEKNSANFDDMQNILTVERVDELMMQLYTQLLEDSVAQKGYQEFLELLVAQKEGATLFHCFAGKDRTGIGAMLFLKLLGVSDELVIADYLKTNESRREANKALIVRAREEEISEEHAQALLRALSVDESYLKHVMTLIIDQYESFENYAAQKLNFGQRQVDLLKELYLKKQ